MEAAEATASSTIYLTPVGGVASPCTKKNQTKEETLIENKDEKAELSRRSLQKAESEDASTYLWGIHSFVSMSIDKGTIRRKFT